jgi:hypothetical protein
MALAERPASNKILALPQPANIQLPDEPDESEQVDIVDSDILVFFSPQ